MNTIDKFMSNLTHISCTLQEYVTRNIGNYLYVVIVLIITLIISTSEVAIVKFMISIVFSVLVSVIGLIGFLCSVFVNFIVMNDFYIVTLYLI